MYIELKNVISILLECKFLKNKLEILQIASYYKSIFTYILQK